MANRNEKMLNITNIRKMRIKTAMRYHLTLLRIAIMKKFTTNKCWWVWRKKELFYTVGRKINWCSCYGKEHGGFLQS